MKKIIIILTLIMLLASQAYALETTLVTMRSKIFEESKAIKSLLTKSKDIILLSTLWDSCIMTMTQLDAYFSLVGLFNTIKKENTTEAAVVYLADWLREIKKTNDLNIIGLSAIKQAIDPNTIVYMEKLKGYFGDLNKRIDAELEKIAILKKSLEKRKSR